MNRDNRVYGYNEYKKYYGRGNKIDNRRRDMDGTQYTSNRTMAIRANGRRNTNKFSEYVFAFSVNIC